MRYLILVSLVACPSAPKSNVGRVDPNATEPLARSIVSAMKPDVDPCVDFYEYACGGWRETTVLPPDRSIITRSFTSIFDENQKVIHEILEGAMKAPGDDPVLQKLGAYYGACMDTEAIEAAGTKPVEGWLARVDEVTDARSAVKLAGELQMFGPNPFIEAGVWADDKQPDTNLLQIHQGGLGLPDRSYYVDLDDKGKALLAEYEAFMARMFGMFGDDPADAEKRAASVVGFETALAGLHWERAALRDSEKVYNKMTVAEAAALGGPGFPIEAWLQGGGITPPKAVNVATPDVITGMGALLEKTDASVLRDYLRWQVITWSAPYLTAAIDEENFGFFGTAMSGQKAQLPRWKRCVSRTEDAMGEWLGKAYVDRKFAGDSKQVAEQMVKGIFDAFERNLPNLEWMDDATRARAVEKADAFVAKLGYPVKYRDYDDLPVDATSHFANVREAGLFNTTWSLAKVDQPVDRDEWHMTPQTVNAYFNPPQTEIVFPAGIMQAPFFSRDFPKALNYGALGMVIGHELTHGFDDEGRKYAPSGRLEEWWEPEVAERFEERAQCVSDQYARYEVQPGLAVNGELTLGENIADLGGLKMAHLAYRDWVKANGEEPKVAGLTGDQLFFVGFAQGWCTVASDEVERMRIATDPHSPPRFRVNGPVINYPAFAEAFECAPGAPMAPKDVCEVW